MPLWIHTSSTVSKTFLFFRCFCCPFWELHQKFLDHQCLHNITLYICGIYTFLYLFSLQITVNLIFYLHHGLSSEQWYHIFLKNNLVYPHKKITQQSRELFSLEDDLELILCTHGQWIKTTFNTSSAGPDFLWFSGPMYSHVQVLPHAND